MAEGVECEDDGLLRGFFFGGVSGMEDGFDADRFDFGCELAEPLFAAGGDDEVCATTREGDGCGASDACAGSGDEGGFAGEGRAAGCIWNALLFLDGSIRV